MQFCNSKTELFMYIYIYVCISMQLFLQATFPFRTFLYNFCLFYIHIVDFVNYQGHLQFRLEKVYIYKHTKLIQLKHTKLIQLKHTKLIDNLEFSSRARRIHFFPYPDLQYLFSSVKIYHINDQIRTNAFPGILPSLLRAWCSRDPWPNSPNACSKYLKNFNKRLLKISQEF